jgi:DNA-binding XRE family transcriptional regulator
LKQKRLSLGLYQKDVAYIIGVSTDTITYWESNKITPMVSNFPSIISFLGYNPVPKKDDSLGERIKFYRQVHGLNHKKFGKIIGVDASTIGSWEANESKPKTKAAKRLEKLLATIPSSS